MESSFTKSCPILTLVKKEDVSTSVSAIPVTTAGPRVLRN